MIKFIFFYWICNQQKHLFHMNMDLRRKLYKYFYISTILTTYKFLHKYFYKYCNLQRKQREQYNETQPFAFWFLKFHSSLFLSLKVKLYLSLVRNRRCYRFVKLENEDWVLQYFFLNYLYFTCFLSFSFSYLIPSSFLFTLSPNYNQSCQFYLFHFGGNGRKFLYWLLIGTNHLGLNSSLVQAFLQRTNVIKAPILLLSRWVSVGNHR